MRWMIAAALSFVYVVIFIAIVAAIMKPPMEQAGRRDYGMSQQLSITQLPK